MNRIKMQIYHCEKMFDEQKCKTKEYDRKKAAVYRLKKKELDESKREKNRIRQQKYIVTKIKANSNQHKEISKTCRSSVQNC